MAASRRWILLIPIVFSLAWILFNYIWVFSQEAALTDPGRITLKGRQGMFFVSNLLILLPNFLLSFLLWTYIKTAEKGTKEALILCFFAIGGGFLPQIFLSIAYYDLWYQEGDHLPLIVYGFPFTYLIGMMAGWVIGLAVVSVVSENQNNKEE